MKTLLFRFEGTKKEYDEQFGQGVSVASSEVCHVCEGYGTVPMPDGPEDFTDEVCNTCNGTGKIILTTV